MLIPASMTVTVQMPELGWPLKVESGSVGFPLAVIGDEARAVQNPWKAH
jgi:hypothetical protein